MDKLRLFEFVLKCSEYPIDRDGFIEILKHTGYILSTETSEGKYLLDSWDLIHRLDEKQKALRKTI